MGKHILCVIGPVAVILIRPKPIDSMQNRVDGIGQHLCKGNNAIPFLLLNRGGNTIIEVLSKLWPINEHPVEVP